MLCKLSCWNVLFCYKENTALQLTAVPWMLNLMVIQIEVCQRFVCMVFVDSPHYSNEDHVERDFPISLSMWVGAKNAVLSFCFLKLRIRPSVFTEFKLNQVKLPQYWIQFLSSASCWKSESRIVTGEEHTVLGKHKRVSGANHSKSMLMEACLAKQRWHPAHARHSWLPRWVSPRENRKKKLRRQWKPLPTLIEKKSPFGTRYQNSRERSMGIFPTTYRPAGGVRCTPRSSWKALQGFLVKCCVALHSVRQWGAQNNFPVPH